MVPPGTTLGNDSSGYGFYVLGDPAVTNVDLVFTNASANNMEEPGGVKLYNEFGELQYSLCWDLRRRESQLDQRLTFIGTDMRFLGEGQPRPVRNRVMATMSFGWVDSDIYTPGAVNDGQTLIGWQHECAAAHDHCFVRAIVLLTCSPMRRFRRRTWRR
jgi:hypothetical protein